MKHTLLFFAFGLNIFAACNNAKAPDDEAVVDSSEKDSPVTVDKNVTCYAYINNKDSILLHLEFQGNHLSGDLVYNLFEKDKNTGTIEGEMKGDTMCASYTFLSEGVNSIREVAFLKKGNTLSEGFGDAEQKDNKMVFKDRNALNFNQNIVLKESPCDQ